jgi:hypothetical protein
MGREADRIYDSVNLTEDVTWRGTVLVRGFLVVAPQVTLRIEPGTSVRFLKAGSGRNGSRLVVMGRIQSTGTADRPILFASDAAFPEKGDWGGILLLSSEKNNQFEHVSIEGAEIGIEARFSRFSLTATRIMHAAYGLVMHDSIGAMEAGSSVTACDTAIEIHDSEFELRDSLVAKNRLGISLYRSALFMAATSLAGNDRQGVQAVDGRIRLSSCDISDNGSGALFRGGEGQIFMTRFLRNRDTALHLIGARMRVNRSVIADNLQVGVRSDDGRATIWGCAFYNNGGYHLYNGGRDEISAVQNWWGTADRAAIRDKIFDAARDPGTGEVQVFPWLQNRPAVLP